jgi:hypothetical protein
LQHVSPGGPKEAARGAENMEETLIYEYFARKTKIIILTLLTFLALC